MLAKGEALPVDFKGRAIYYVGPVDPIIGEVVGPAGPTTATRMDSFTDMMCELGLLTMIGKAERGQGATKVIADHKVAYLMAVGGAAYLVARAIREAKVVAFADLGMEAIYEFTVEDPSQYLQPWKGEMSLNHSPQPIYEYACHEGNYSFNGILMGARVLESQGRKPSLVVEGE